MENLLWKIFIRAVVIFIWAWGFLVMMVGFKAIALGDPIYGVISIILGSATLVIGRQAWRTPE